MSVAVLHYSRPYSPVPPPMPSPTLTHMPLPSPPAHSRRLPRDRPSSSRGSRKPFQPDCPDSPVFAIKDAILCSNSAPSWRRREAGLEDEDIEASFLEGSSTSHRRRTYEGRDRLPLPPPSPQRRTHRRTDSNSFTITEPSSPRFSSKPRMRSPASRSLPRDAPPVPPLPSGHQRTSPAPIRIPELGLGLDESLRSPVSHSSHSSPPSTSSHDHIYSLQQRRSKEEDTSFLLLDRQNKHAEHRTSLTDPLPGCLPLRSSHSNQNIKARGKGRSNMSFAGRFLRLGTPQAH